MTSFFICDDDWEKDQEITLEDMGSSSEEDSYIMRETRLSDLVEDEKQKLLKQNMRKETWKVNEKSAELKI